jgi:hypothetical protein
MEELMKSMETEYNWEDKSNIPRIDQTVLLESIQDNEGEALTGHDKRISVDEDQFVDALASPIEKPKDWGDTATLTEDSLTVD